MGVVDIQLVLADPEVGQNHVDLPGPGLPHDTQPKRAGITDDFGVPLDDVGLVAGVADDDAGIIAGFLDSSVALLRQLFQFPGAEDQHVAIVVLGLVGAKDRNVRDADVLVGTECTRRRTFARGRLRGSRLVAVATGI